MSLKDLIKEIKEDGVIDAVELEQLKAAILADGKVDREEVEALFDLNNTVTGQPNTPDYLQFFVDTITDSILEDGVVDQEEADFLIAQIGSDGNVDPQERALLANIKAKATGELPANLVEYLASLGI